MVVKWSHVIQPQLDVGAHSYSLESVGRRMLGGLGSILVQEGGTHFNCEIKGSSGIEKEKKRCKQSISSHPVGAV